MLNYYLECQDSNQFYPCVATCHVVCRAWTVFIKIDICMQRDVTRFGLCLYTISMYVFIHYSIDICEY